MKILAVDDDARVRKVLKPMLEFWENTCIPTHQTDFANNGLEAVQWIQQHGMPDMLLLDVRMPIMNGAEFLQHARHQRWNLTAKVLLLTGYADDLERHIGSDALQMPHLRKPFTMHELHTALDALVTKNNAAKT